MVENFIIAKHRILFDKQLESGIIDNEAVVFIEDTHEIWTHGKYYATPLSISAIPTSEVKAMWDALASYYYNSSGIGTFEV